MGGLIDHIRDTIEKNGPLSVAGYMELALQHPDFGYYRHQDPLGRGGDFITAPEISQMFGEIIGLFCAETWRQMGRPSPFMLLELGPGRGTLLEDALRATAKISGFHTALNLYLLESNESLRASQREKLAVYHPSYLEDLREMPKMPTIAVANEFFDALPIRQFEKTDKGWCERMVISADNELMFVLSPPSPSFMLLVPQSRRDAPIGTVHELSLPGLSIARRLTHQVMTQRGAVLIVDYGYSVPSGHGSLQAVSGHRFADVLERPGEVDLTAHVDFSALKHMAQSQNAAVFGPTGQGEFLAALGIEMRALQLKHRATPDGARAIDSALLRLCDPGQMGTLFKAMAITHPQMGTPAGF